jgi:hypothetical protein
MGFCASQLTPDRRKSSHLKSRPRMVICEIRAHVHTRSHLRGEPVRVEHAARRMGLGRQRSHGTEDEPETGHCTWSREHMIRSMDHRAVHTATAHRCTAIDKGTNPGGIKG